MENVKISIKEMVEFISRKGHISNEITGPNRALEGTKIHQKIQRSQEGNYQSEVTLNYEMDYKNYHYILQGRMDGLIIDKDFICIDEIKSTLRNLDDLNEETMNMSHFNQLICYAYIYSVQNNLSLIQCRLTYVHVESKEIKYINFEYNFDEIEKMFNHIIAEFNKFVELYFEFKIKRDQSLNKLTFPYDHYRNGQQEMMNGVYYTIKNNQKLFIHAATGLGKTLATIYPSLIAMKNGYTNKIMYLTAKTITRTVAYDSLQLLINQGLVIRSIIIHAKDNMCFLEKRECHPDHCPYAKNHYARVNKALIDILENEHTYTKENIQSYALKHQVCPFEFSLDIYLFCDFSILDYNYAFDPKVYLQRAYAPSHRLTLLVDEAHNLIDRSRSMYSAMLYYSDIQYLKNYMAKKHKGVYKSLLAIEDLLVKIHYDLDELPYIVNNEPPVTLAALLERFIFAMQKYLVDTKDVVEERALQVYFDVISFLRIYELYRESYRTYIVNYDDDLMIKMFCIDPSSLLQEFYKQTQAVIFFSATLLPVQYFYRILGGKEPDLKLYYESPFNIDNRLVLIGDDVHTRYKERMYSFDKICDYIITLALSKTGNYIVFFSSYEYLEQVYERFMSFNYEVDVYKQDSQMTNSQKEEFLEKFKTNNTHSQVFFSVLGGMFSEGIDFKGEQLIGTIIVGVGLPQLNLERDLIKDYFDDQGYDYAYKYPGMNKVLQAAGRVIRTASDYGVVVLLDDRYCSLQYRKIFPNEWKNARVTKINQFKQYLSDFWAKK